MVLERKLSSAKGALDTLGNRINGLQRQLETSIYSPKR